MHVYMYMYMYIHTVYVRDFHEDISVVVLEYHVAHHHLNLLNGHSLAHTQVTNVCQKPEVKKKISTGSQYLHIHVCICASKDLDLHFVMPKLAQLSK